MFGGLRSGSWWVSSKSDPRWDKNGSSNFVGMFSMPKECQDHIDKMKKKLKIEPPEDLYWSYMKD
jgi:hypothetical protein